LNKLRICDQCKEKLKPKDSGYIKLEPTGDVWELCFTCMGKLRVWLSQNAKELNNK